MNLKRITGTPFQGAFHRLKDFQDGKLLIQYLKECLQDLDYKNRRLSNEDLYRGQGAALFTEALLALLEAEVKVTKEQTNA